MIPKALALPNRLVMRVWREAIVLATRKPTLLLRLSVVFLLRFAERRFCGLLFQEPPRKTREGAVQGGDQVEPSFSLCDSSGAAA